jgi:ABC-type sugar transport system ATPase subunit
MNDSDFEIRALSCTAGSFALRDINLRVPLGTYLTLVGPSGSGKTMLLEAVAGLRTLTAGSLRFGERDLTALPPEARGLGFAYQDSLLYPFLTVRQNILFGAAGRGRAKQEPVRRRLTELAEVMGLTHLLERYPRFLSGGEKQRVSLARALLLQPALLLLDEPLSALDWRTKSVLRQLLAELQRRERMTVFHVTHDLEEAAALGMMMAVMENGRIGECGRLRELLRNSRAGFLSPGLSADGAAR